MRKEFLEKLEQLVNISSWSMDPAGVAKVADVIEGWFKDLGWQVQRHDVGSKAGPLLQITNKGTERYDAALLGHMGLGGSLHSGGIGGLGQGQQRQLVGIIAAAGVELDLGAFRQIRKIQCGRLAHIRQGIREGHLGQDGRDQRRAVNGGFLGRLVAAGGDAQQGSQNQDETDESFCGSCHSDTSLYTAESCWIVKSVAGLF